MEGVGAVAGKIFGVVGKALGRTRIGSATAKVFTEAGSKISAVRQGIKSFEGKTFTKIGKAFGKEPWMSPSKLGFGDDAITIYNKNNLVPKEGWTDVVVHGSEKGNKFIVDGRKINAQELSQKMINEGYQEGSPVRLVSCHSGRTCTGGAAQLSEILKTKVEAPTVPVETLKDGTFKLHNYKNVEKKWVTFENGRKLE